MAIKKGDFIRISFVLTVKETGQILEVTDEELAKKEGLFDEKNNYGPRLMVVGNEEMFLKRLNDAVVGKNVNEKFTVDIPPEETFGYRDTSKVKVLGRKELISKNIVPEVGRQIQYGNQTGTVLSVLGGRVRVDFNHPLVGQIISYEVEILEKISSMKKKIGALIDYRMPGIEVKDFIIKNEKTKVSITMPEEIIAKDPYLQLRKIRIANDLNKSFPDKKEIVFIDTFKFNGSD